jgi:hypothetical protein
MHLLAHCNEGVKKCLWRCTAIADGGPRLRTSELLGALATSMVLSAEKVMGAKCPKSAT